MLRILYIIPTLEGGGAERQLFLLAGNLSARGAEIHVACRRGGVFLGQLREHGVSVHLLGEHRGVSPLLFFKIVKLIRALVPDVIQTWLPQMDVVGGGAALFSSIPWVLS